MRDHPRIRGEHERRPALLKLNRGSSPHTRGARHFIPGMDLNNGIIPAYAGSTIRRAACRCSKWDHPRIRGEHDLSRRLRLGATGSSPHTRGARRIPLLCSGWRRIIPAYAGSTFKACAPPSTTADHPRIRGEHFFTIQDTPLTNGIIPAYAGSTPRSSAICFCWTDHPRIRGEHTWKSLQYQGSPP